MSQIERIKQAIMADLQNQHYTERGIKPLFAAPKTARINIIWAGTWSQNPRSRTLLEG